MGIVDSGNLVDNTNLSFVPFVLVISGGFERLRLNQDGVVLRDIFSESTTGSVGKAWLKVDYSGQVESQA